MAQTLITIALGPNLGCLSLAATPAASHAQCYLVSGHAETEKEEQLLVSYARRFGGSMAGESPWTRLTPISCPNLASLWDRSATTYSTCRSIAMSASHLVESSSHMEGTMLRTWIASVLIGGLTYGAASAKVISPDLDRRITVEPTVTANNLSGVRALTGLNPNRKIHNGERSDRRRAYVSIHHFDTT